MATALEDSSKLANRLAAALRQVDGIKLEQSGIEIEGLSDLVSCGFVALVNSGVAPAEIRTHVEASGLTDKVRDKPQGTRMRIHAYAAVTAELVQRSERAFRHR